MKARITKREVEKTQRGVEATKAEAYRWDDKLAGFGLRVKPSLVTTYVLSYYAPGLHRVKRRLTIGTFPPMSPDEARASASALLARIAKGDDPASENAEQRRTAKDETVARLFKDYLDYAEAHFSPRTVESYESCGRLYVLPALGRLPVQKVTTRVVATLHLEMRRTPHMANRCVQLIKAFFYWLERRGLFDGKNPARGVELYTEKARERFLTVEDMARVGQALRIAEMVGLPAAPEHVRTPDTKKSAKKPRPRNAGMFTSELLPASPVSLAALRFLLFTGWREQEAMTLTWSAVNLDTGVATLTSTKTGKSVRVLGAPALALVSAQQQVEGSPYVFPGRDPEKPLESVHRLWTAVRHEARLDDVRLHDLRHSVASVAGGHGYSLFLIGKLLGHKTARSTERYAHLADDARKVMADTVAETIRAAMSLPSEAEQRHSRPVA